MKQCPACRTTYTDDSLKFCLADGTVLTAVADEEPTAVRPPASERARVNVPPVSDRTVVVPGSPPARGPSSKLIVFVIGGILLGVAAIAVLGIAGVAYYYSSAGNGNLSDPPPRASTPRPTATVDAEKERLRDELGNIQKRIDEQKRSANNNNLPPTRGDDRDEFAVTAVVDSPNDGFLALRDKPDVDRGERLAKIPHGAEVEIMNCEKKAVVVAGRSGRWCQVEYNGQNGWVFDAWLEY